jgi:hypothetical protein
MISVVVYGRNDSHGYNLHKRMALSLNSIAEVLEDQDDEIIFVDWNSPQGMPPVPVAIADTLSAKAKSILRIIVVPNSVHQNLIEGKSQKVVVEPVARNVGARRARPQNNWILSTNTDALLATGNTMLCEYVRKLAPGYYGSPRFELPEWVWESLSRVDSVGTQKKIEVMMNGGIARVKVRSYGFSVFDGCGDFQLMDRSSFGKIGGFDETMLLGWHVDSNLARRMHEFHGESREAPPEIGVFHCNHNRSETHYFPATSTSNNLERYVFGDVSSIARSGQDSWGLPSVQLREVTISDFENKFSSYFDSIGSEHFHETESSSTSYSDRLNGVSAEVTLPFLADRLFTSAEGTMVMYLGCRDSMRNLLSMFCEENGLQFVSSSAYETPSSLYDTLVVVDLSPTGIYPGVKSLSELPAFERSNLRETLLAFRQRVLADIQGVVGNCTYLVLNAEGNEFTPVLESVIRPLPAQYYARLRIGSLRPELRGQRPPLAAKVASVIVDMLSGLIKFWKSHVRPALLELPRDSTDSRWTSRVWKPRLVRRFLMKIALSPKKQAFLRFAAQGEVVSIPLSLREEKSNPPSFLNRS